MTQPKNETTTTPPSTRMGSSATANQKDEPPKSTERLREDIARTRAALSDDMAALGDKLNPEQLKADAKEVFVHAKDAAREGARDMVRDAKEAAVDSLRHAKDHALESISEGVSELGYRARTVGHDVSDFVATHAVPLTLAGAGLGWLLVSMSHQRRMQQPDYRRMRGDYDLESSVRARAGALTQRAGNALHESRDRLVSRAHELETQVSERVGEIKSQVVEGASELGEQASELGHRAYDGVGRAGSRMVEVSEENPLATGLLILAAGAAAGFLLPASRRENQWMGGTRDRLVDKAQRTATELKESVQNSANEVRGAIAELQQPSHA